MKNINIIVDASGSMGEDEKNAVVKYLLNGMSSVQKNKSLDISLSLYQWGVETKKIDDIEKAKISFAGKNTIEGLDALCSLLDSQDAVILISDGNFESDIKKKIKELSNNILPIFVGVDANRTILQDISTSKIVYSVVDFVQALFDAWIIKRGGSMIKGGISFKGTYHEINQDCFLAREYEDGYVLVVSDGMGSKKMSQYGSKAICEAIYELISTKHINLDLFSFKDVLYMCHEEWKKRLYSYDINQCYATMLVVVVTDKKIRAGRLGDGFIGIYTNQGVECLFDKKDDYFANETDCLCEQFGRDKLEILEIEYESLFGVVACTDGIEVGTMQESELAGFTRDLVDEYRKGDEESVKNEIESWLIDWPGRDDKTMAFLMEGEK